MSLLCTYFPPDTTVGKNDSIGPQYGTGEPTYLDTLKTWYPTGYLYEVVRIDSNQYYETWNVIFNGTEYTCNTVSGDSIQTVLRDLEVGILDKFEEPSFTLYPNPTKGEIHIKFNDIQARPEEIRITDLTGRTLKEIIVDPNVNEVVYTLSGLPEGMYLINLGGETKKLVINKFSD